VEIDCGPPTQRKVLALLLVAGGQPVSMTQLVELLWEGTPPASAANGVHRSIGLLRHQFEPDLPTRQRGQWLVRQQGNYRLNVSAETLDLLRFRELSSSARAQTEPTKALREFRAALDPWHGRCADGIDLTFARIDRERVLIAQEAAEAARAAGRPQDVLTVLRQLASLNPTDEALHAELIRSLAAAGHQAEALAAYAAVSRALANEIGIPPGPALRTAQEQILRQQPAQSSGRQTAEPNGPSAPVIRPAQLPPDLRVFAGRDDELARLAASIPPHTRGVPITAINGMAGVGKTTLAVHWAHELAASCTSTCAASIPPGTA
jgi:DNA-binding SARP family transcriptional activator